MAHHRPERSHIHEVQASGVARGPAVIIVRIAASIFRRRVLPRYRDRTIERMRQDDRRCSIVDRRRYREDMASLSTSRMVGIGATSTGCYRLQIDHRKTVSC